MSDYESPIAKIINVDAISNNKGDDEEETMHILRGALFAASDTFTNSPLAVYTKLSPNNSGRRTHAIDRISPHCVVGQCGVEALGSLFSYPERQASSNYGIGTDGRIALYVEEKNRSWCTSSNANDQRAVTIECASDTTAPYAMNGAVYESLVRLCVDICQRNGKTKLLWLGNKDKTFSYEPQADEMVITVHRWLANKDCPGDWLYSRLGELADTVTYELVKADIEAKEAEEAAAKEARVKAAIRKLADNGVINTPEYWESCYNELQYLDRLIINMAEKFDKTVPEQQTPGPFLCHISWHMT